MFSYIVSEMKRKKKRALILTNRIELLTETGGTLEQFDLKPYLITAGQMAPPSRYHQVYVAMAQTLKNRIEAKHYPKEWAAWFRSFDLVIIDECHIQEFNHFFLGSPENPELYGQNVFNGAYVLGFTATPERRGKQRQLASDYTALITGPTVTELIEKGKLVKDHYYGIESPDLTGIKLDSKGEDYQESDLYNRFNKPELYAGCVQAWQKHTPNTITLCFCVNIQHAIETCRAFNETGIKAKFVVSDVAKPQLQDNPTQGQTARYEKHLQEYENYIQAVAKWSGNRKEIIQQWKDRKFDVLINAGILTTGFNFKPIQTVIINRATISNNLWLQMIGRGSRPYPGKDFFNILDFGDHGRRLGYYQSNRVYSLIHETKEGGGAAPVKECGKQHRAGVKPNILTGYTEDKAGRPGCGAYINASTMICPFCGYTYDTDKEKIVAELKLIDYNVLPYDGAMIRQPNKYEEIERFAESKGYKPGWVHAQIAFKHGYSGLSEYAKQKGYSQGWAWRIKKQFHVD